MLRLVIGGWICCIALFGLSTFSQVNAATIAGGSTLLDGSSANQLENWLGQGEITLTNIYTKASGDTSHEFHLAVDGMGPTFVVMSATNLDTRPNPTAIVGGFNPQSWRRQETSTFDPFDPYPLYNVTLNDADRTAFLFNLSTNSLFRQKLSNELNQGVDQGIFQTYNNYAFGPSFGAIDLRMNGDLTTGYGFLNWAYGGVGSIVDGHTSDGNQLGFGAIEVFTVSVSPVPEPETYAMLLAGLGLLGFAVKRRKQTV